jgi:hypothetical protein
MNKIFGLGCLFLAVFLLIYSVILFMSRRGHAGVYYCIAAGGFFSVYLSYRRNERKKGQ